MRMASGRIEHVTAAPTSADPTPAVLTSGPTEVATVTSPGRTSVTSPPRKFVSPRNAATNLHLGRAYKDRGESGAANFQVFAALDFLADLTQHISFTMGAR